ncbi:hypothetical protein IFM89_036729 [Coptis chinensis]|uniref:Uncharacterized protein n=1 Tax=Coptis chinensis TaxID=261450 RepID=A0A835IEL4_9MAGN|nr:hypothetical protein IFM89_036729 [Coptis chinensis]
MYSHQNTVLPVLEVRSALQLDSALERSSGMKTLHSLDWPWMHPPYRLPPFPLLEQSVLNPSSFHHFSVQLFLKDMAVGFSVSNESRQYNDKMTPFVILSCMMAAMGGVIFGYDIGISGCFYY